MTLVELFAGAGPEFQSVRLPGEALGVECDSRKVEKGFVFVAIRGSRADGNAHIEEAIRRGAVAVVSDVPHPADSIPFLTVSDARLAAARLAASFYGNPSARLCVVGITGTNGKTTSSYLIEHLLRDGGRKVGVIGTVNYRYAGREIPAVETTPGPLMLQAVLSRMAQSVDTVVMEVSSHALDQARVAGVRFSSALFTNLTQDHLDYHGTFEAYFEAKAKLFDGLSKDSAAVLNADDPWSEKIRARTKAEVFTYGVLPARDGSAGGGNAADLRAENIHYDLKGTVFEISHEGKSFKVQSPLVGLHNVYNVLGALLLCRVMGRDLSCLLGALTTFKGVPGRLEAVEAGQNFHVFIDFAHTPDGLENVLKSLLPYKKKRLVAVFGCGGDRDRTKRPRMGAIAARYADYVIVTADNPRSEDPRTIAEEIRSGFPDDFKNYALVVDRKKAIRQALLAAREGDIVILAGKGHERTQIIGGAAFSFSDREEAEKVLNGH